MKRATRNLLLLALGLGLPACATVTGGPPKGDTEEKSEEDQAKLAAVGSAVKGKVVWSSSRLGNHDLFVSNPDGSDVKQITKGDAVDWFPRFSPDGTQILFIRSKKGWVSERDANAEGKWDLYIMPAGGGSADGGEPKKIVDNASWGTWVDGENILFVRGTKLYQRKLEGGDEKALLDSEAVEDLDGALLQQPQMSSDGRYIAITLRGSKRETGIWDLEKKTWTRTGDGCQINWTPDGKSVYWVHPTGNGTSRVFRQEVAGSKLAKEVADDERTFMDLPGRRSHEYFPQLSRDGQWMVWAATQRGHDHDVADYEIYIWKVGEAADKAARLTFHSGNDRWPDIYLPSAAATAPEAAPTEKTAAATEPAPALAAAAPEEGLVKASAKPSKSKAAKRKVARKKSRRR